VKKALLILVALAAIGAGVLAYIAIDPFADESDPTTAHNLTGSACQRLAGLAAVLAQEDPGREKFLLAIGKNGAGIRGGPRGVGDLLHGGHNRIRGKGFRERYDDDTDGQVRHFSGIVAAVVLADGNPTLWISRHLRDDPKGSPDDNLTEQGVAFATAIQKGELKPDEAGDWILGHLCRRKI
jgi:hypothetical protein